MADDVVIKVDGVSKDFLLPHERTQSIKTAFVNGIKGKRNRTMQKQHALKDISFEVKRGEFFGIVGRNGSGKSTLLKILAQIYQPTKGSVQVKGRLVPFIELGVGFNPELTGRDNVYLSGSLLGFSEAEVDAMYDDIVEFAELEKFMDQKLKNYSSGMQVRLAFSVAVRVDADVLLIDEVLAVGDADFQKKCFDYFKKLKRDNKTVIFVSHDMDAIKEYCDRALLIEKACIKKYGDSHTVSDYYNKLFNNESTMRDINDAKRWGDKTLRYEKVSVSPRVLHKNHANVTISANVIAHTDVLDPVFGFSIKNETGEYLMGTNTTIENIVQPAIKNGEKIEILWSVPNIFSDGVYSINVTAEHTDGKIQSDWLEAVATFQVKKEATKKHHKVSPEIGFNSSRK